MKKNILFVFLLFIFKLGYADDLNYSRVKIWFEGKSEMSLGKLGIDLTEGEYRKGQWFISDFSEKEISQIQIAGFRTEILISDVRSFYINRNKKSTKNFLTLFPH